MSDARPAAGSPLTPTAAAVAGLVLAGVALLAGNAWVFLAQEVAALTSYEHNPDVIVRIVGLIEAVVAALALLLARRSLATLAPAEPPVVRHLAGAAYVVGGLGMVVGLLTFVLSLV